MESTEDYSDDQDFECGSYDETIFAEKDSIKENDQDILIHNPSAYCVLNSEQADSYIEDLINDLVDELGITESAAVSLLKKYGWDQQKVMDHLADNLDLFQAEDNSQEFVCSICFIEESRKKACSFGCNHYYCKNCFQEFIKTAVNEGQPLKNCPTEACKAVLTPKLFLGSFQNDEDMFKKYKKCLIQNVVASSSNLLWCPGTECGNIIQLLKMKKNHKSLVNIRCACGQCFCMKCRDVAHRPLSCDHFAKWRTGIMGGGEKEDLMNFDWIEKNSKPCPQCQVNIEKNKGCMHMTCRNCKHQFCWICLRNWKTHSADECNSFKPSLQELFTNQQKGHESFYKERFGHHWNSLKYAVWKKKRILENFKSINAQTPHKEDDSFLIETLDSILDARRAISMTYAAGDYRKRLGLQMDMHELQQSLLWEALDHLDKNTDDLQSIEHMKGLFMDPDQAGCWIGNLESYKIQLKIKTEEIVIVCNKLLKAMEEEFENVKDLQLQEGLDKYYRNEDWHCEVCTFKNPKTSKICKECGNAKTVFGDYNSIKVS